MLRIFITALFLSVSLFAADTAEKTPDTQAEKTVSLDKEETFQFVKAFIQIENFRSSLNKKVLDENGEVDKSKLEEVNKEFQAKAQEFIKKEGLTMQSYSKYIQLLQASPDFQKLVQQIIASLTQKPAN